MKPTRFTPLALLAYGTLCVAVFYAAASLLGLASLDMREIVTNPAMWATACALSIIGWLAGEYIASPWTRMAGVAETFRTEKGRREDPVLEEGEIVALVEHGVEQLRRTEQKLEQARLVLYHKNRRQESRIESNRRALILMLEDLKEANAKLREVDRLKMDFMNVTSHELRNPLTPIVTYGQMLKEERLGRLNSEQKTAVGAIARNAETLRMLVSDILDISKLEGRRMKYSMEKDDVGKIVRECAEGQRGAAGERGISIGFVEKGTPAKLKIDRNRIAQAVNNYLTNAIKFSHDGGKIDVAVSWRKDGALVSVTDHGAGIPKAEYGKIFTKFGQVNSMLKYNRGGTGLGLAICKWIVEDHGGDVGFSSKAGRGSTFWLFLPRRFSPRTQNIVGAGETKNMGTLSESKHALKPLRIEKRQGIKGQQ